MCLAPASGNFDPQPSLLAVIRDWQPGLVSNVFLLESPKPSKASAAGLGAVLGFPGGASGKEPTCQCRRHEMWVQSLGREDPLEESMATHCSILAWRIPMDRVAWRAMVRSVAQSWTQLKRPSTYVGTPVTTL